MRVTQSVFFGFVLSCLILSVPAQGVVIEPTNVILPGSPGGTFSFDFAINNPMGTSAYAFQSTIGVSGPGTLTFDAASSEAVASAADYWIFGNSTGAAAIDRGGNNYEFGDSPDNPPIEALLTGDIMARYAFTWDGTAGDYTFTLDFDTTKSFILNESFLTEALQFSPGDYDGDSSSFTVSIPEPTTLMLMGLGTVVLFRKLRA